MGRSFLSGRRNISEIGILIKANSLIGVSFRVEGKYPSINGGVDPSGYSNHWNDGENSITISEGGNSCGYVNYITQKFWLGGHCYSLKPKGNIDKHIFCINH